MAGVYSAQARPGCCWLAPSAAFAVGLPAGSDELELTIFIPTYALKHGQKQSFVARLDGGAPQKRCCYGIGLWSLRFGVPVSRDDRTVHVALQSGSFFVPAERGINGDRRRLTVLLLRVRALRSTGGAVGGRFEAPASRAYRVGIPILFAVLFAAVAFATVRLPCVGLAAMLLSDPFALYFGVGHTTITLPKVVLVATAFGLIAHLRGLRAGRAFWAIVVGLLLLFCSMLLSSLHALDAGAAMRETLKTAQYLATFVFAYEAFRLQSKTTWVQRSIAAVTISVAVLAMLQMFVEPASVEPILGHLMPRASGPLEGPNQLSGFLDITLPMLFAWMLEGRRDAVTWAAFLLGCTALALTLSRGGIASALFAFALMAALRYWPSRRLAAWAVTGVAWIAAFALACAEFLGIARANAFFGNRNDSEAGGVGTRTELWDAAHRLWRQAPLLGIGPANFERNVSRWYPGVWTHANSLYFNTLAEQGIVGLLAVGALFALAIGALVRHVRRPAVLGAFGALVAMAFHQIVDTMWFYPKVGVIFWTVLAIAAAMADAEEPAPQ